MTTKNAFHWRKAPSASGDYLMRGLHKPPAENPVPIVYSKRNATSSIASAEPLKRKPAVGAMRTA